jgi:MFS family permease
MVRAILARDRNRASAWYQVGLLGGGALGGALILWLAARLSLPVVGFSVALMIALPGLVAFTIPEAPPEASPWFKGRLKQIAGEFLALARSPTRRWSVLLLLGPGSTGAAMYLLPAIASSYGVGGDGVLWINGAGGGLLLAAGALSGALVPSDWDRRLAYAGAGMTNALAVFILLGAPRSSKANSGNMVAIMRNALSDFLFGPMVPMPVKGTSKYCISLTWRLDARNQVVAAPAKNIAVPTTKNMVDKPSSAPRTGAVLSCSRSVGA